MLGEERSQEIAKKVLSLSGADQTEVLIFSKDEQLTRFAMNTIHQNVSERNVTVRVRCVFGKKTGVASGNDTSEEALRDIVKSSETVARFQQDNPDFRSLPGPQPVQELKAFFEPTTACRPEHRAKGAATICSLARRNSLVAAGAFSTAVDELTVANSLGLSAYHPRTIAHLVTVIMGQNSSGYASAAAMDVDQIDPAGVGHAAVEKALASKNPTEIDPGIYTVILEENALADMVNTLGYLGFDALSVQEGRSFMNDRFGQRITGPQITIWDDGSDPRGLILTFDYEGVPKQKVTLIEKGIATGVVYDSFTAGRERGRASTGHSLPAPNTWGPYPMNLFMAPGEATKEQLLSSTERGIWVTRFHYTNAVHPVQTVFTGMTRDGTFLIEDGRIARPLKNLRFTQNILEAFDSVEMLGRELKLIKSDWENFATCVPAAKIAKFRFTGTTEF